MLKHKFRLSLLPSTLQTTELASDKGIDFIRSLRRRFSQVQKFWSLIMPLSPIASTFEFRSYTNVFTRYFESQGTCKEDWKYSVACLLERLPVLLSISYYRTVLSYWSHYNHALQSLSPLVMIGRLRRDYYDLGHNCNAYSRTILQVVIPEEEDWEKEFNDWQENLWDNWRKENPIELYKSKIISSTSSAEEEEEWVPAPRITEADHKHDTRSLERMLARRLFLIVNRRGTFPSAWLPSAVLKSQWTIPYSFRLRHKLWLPILCSIGVLLIWAQHCILAKFVR